ncbi:17798_t:CDS:2 [Funneliformis caledonium]|uniref:17798_t:CDS:1 n=1 Tax=Funneliformis caledonium TaxID=1117310 RepID=A0A9N9A2E3_9GLOM|nr:17798_t:CDS:2 [Funneliformis caledonium]
MTAEIKQLLEGELCEEDVLQVPTIQNWILGFSQKWKEAMALHSMDENEDF